MNKQTKIALFIAPILSILGFVLADLWAENNAMKAKAFPLTPSGDCHVLNNRCILKSGDFEINIFDEHGITKLHATYPLDTATLFLVDTKNHATPYQLGMKSSPYYWQRKTPLRSLMSEKTNRYKLRIIIEIKGGKYFAEFHTKIQSLHFNKSNDLS